MNRIDLSHIGLSGRYLADAELTDANLDYAILSGADLTNAGLTNANLANAILTGANLTNADLRFADLTGAILANVIALDTTIGSALYDINTDFTGTGFDPVAAGWKLVVEERDDD